MYQSWNLTFSQAPLFSLTKNSILARILLPAGRLGSSFLVWNRPGPMEDRSRCGCCRSGGEGHGTWTGRCEGAKGKIGLQERWTGLHKIPYGVSGVALERFLLRFVKIFSKKNVFFLVSVWLSHWHGYRWAPLRYNKWDASFWPVYQQVMMMILWLRNSGKRLLRPTHSKGSPTNFMHQVLNGPCDASW